MIDWEKLASGRPDRRGVLGGAAAASAALILSGCASVPDAGAAEAVRRLLTLASQRAFAGLTQPDGFWDNAVARIELPVLFGRPGARADAILRSKPFREQLQHRLNRFAEEGARSAAPVIAQAVRDVSIPAARSLLLSRPTAATTFLRQAVGAGLVNAMIPELEQAMRAADDPVLNQAIKALAGVSLTDAAHALALEADNAIWFAIGASEAAIRRDPAGTDDPVLIAALKAS